MNDLRAKERAIAQTDYSRYDFSYSTKNYEMVFDKGLSEEVVRKISQIKSEPGWMLEFRLKALKSFMEKPMPQWGADLSQINFDEIIYYMRASQDNKKSWDDVPADVKKTFDRLGIPEAERKVLAGVEAQFDSEVMYSNIRTDLEKKGVVFLSMDEGLKQYPEIVKEHFGKIIPLNDNKFASLNSAVWSGGCLPADSLVYTANRGIVKINEISPADIVYSLNEKTKKLEPDNVVASIYNGKKEVFEFTVAGRKLKATGTHKFLTLTKNGPILNQNGKSWKTEWKSLSEMTDEDFIAIPKKIPSETNWTIPLPKFKEYKKNKHLNKLKSPDEPNEELMWLLGIILVDGNIHYPKKDMCHINIALPQTDSAREPAIEAVKNLFEYHVTTKDSASFSIYSKELGMWLNEIGIIGKAHEKRVPGWAFSLPENMRLSLLAGILDADGYIEMENGVLSIELCNEHLIEDTKALASSTGLYSDGKINHRTRQNPFKIRGRINGVETVQTFRCRISGNIVKVPSRKMEWKDKLSEIHNRKRTFDKYNASSGKNFASQTSDYLGFAPIQEKKMAGEMHVYDIQTEKNHNFIANGIFAHNSFVYVPKNVKVDIPLQAYFRINAESFGQFERTLIIADEGSQVHYIEGCSAPKFSTQSLHSAVVEVVARPNSHIRYTTVQNWANNIYNLVTKRAFAYENSTVEWVDGNLGSKVTMKYPAIYLMGKGAKGEVLSIALAGKGQHQDSGAKVVHLAPNTTSTITSKSISKDGGRSSYRGLVKVVKGCRNVKSNVVCDALLLDKDSRTDTYPYVEIDEPTATIAHEARVGKIGEDQIFYLTSKGLSEAQALTLIVLGFIQPFTKTLPLEYAVELNRLIEMEMENSVG